MAATTDGTRAWRVGHAFFIEMSHISGEDTFLIAANLGDTMVTLPLHPDASALLLFSTREISNEDRPTRHLPASSTRLWRQTSRSDLSST